MAEGPKRSWRRRVARALADLATLAQRTAQALDDGPPAAPEMQATPAEAPLRTAPPFGPDPGPPAHWVALVKDRAPELLRPSKAPLQTAPRARASTRPAPPERAPASKPQRPPAPPSTTKHNTPAVDATPSNVGSVREAPNTPLADPSHGPDPLPPTESSGSQSPLRWSATSAPQPASEPAYLTSAAKDEQEAGASSANESPTPPEPSTTTPNLERVPAVSAQEDPWRNPRATSPAPKAAATPTPHISHSPDGLLYSATAHPAEGPAPKFASPQARPPSSVQPSTTVAPAPLQAPAPRWSSPRAQLSADAVRSQGPRAPGPASPSAHPIVCAPSPEPRTPTVEPSIPTPDPWPRLPQTQRSPEPRRWPSHEEPQARRARLRAEQRGA